MKIAIIGSGISGLTSAYLLKSKHEVSLFEANDYLGGHTNTIDVELDDERHQIDTGFIVFNEKTYPMFTRLLNKLGIAYQDSDMSFSVTSDDDSIEYSGGSFGGLFAQRRNIFKPRFYKMLLDIVRFNKIVPNVISMHDVRHLTLGEYIQRSKFGHYFRDYYLIPMTAAIWSMPAKKALKIPFIFFAQFFQNHGLLSVNNQLQWKVLKGGSRQYIPSLVSGLEKNIHCNSTINHIKRHNDYVEIITKGDQTLRFDAVVVATHSDQALAMLDDASVNEQEILSAIPYEENQVTLHTDSSILPRRPLAHASWNYHVDKSDANKVVLTYYMNLLQRIKSRYNFCLTVNDDGKIDPAKVIKEINYHHPTFNLSSVQAQKRHHEINGINRTYYCGAYWGNGFHEDGVKSALAACKLLGVDTW